MKHITIIMIIMTLAIGFYITYNYYCASHHEITIQHAAGSSNGPGPFGTM